MISRAQKVRGRAWSEESGSKKNNIASIERNRALETHAPISNILENSENIFCDLPSIPNLCEDNQNDFCESTQREEDFGENLFEDDECDGNNESMFELRTSKRLNTKWSIQQWMHFSKF